MGFITDSFLLAQTDPVEVAPTTIGEVGATLQETLLKVWKDFVEHLPFLGVAILILFATWGVSRIAALLARKSLSRTHMRNSLRDLILRLITITVWVLGVMLAAIVIFPGLSPAKALGGLGILSMAVGFAFKDIFENFFAGILLLWRFPFENGDFIECEGVKGKVERIDIRMSQIRQTTGELVVVPNAFLFKNPVDVLTDQPKRRITVMAGVSYDTDVEEAVTVIEKAVKSCQTVDTDSPIQVFPQAFGSSSIDIEVTWWSDPKPVDQRRSRGEVVMAVKKALDAAKIEIPFPYRTLTFKEPLPIEQTAK